MNTLIRHKVRQWLGLDRQEDRYVQYEHQNCAIKNTTYLALIGGHFTCTLTVLQP